MFVGVFVILDIENLLVENEIKVWLADDGIVRADHGDSDELNVESILYVNKIMKTFSDKPLPILSYGYKLRTIDYNANEFMASEAFQSSRKAVAVVLGYQMKQFVKELEQQTFRINIPMKLFTSETEALKWLKQYA